MIGYKPKSTIGLLGLLVILLASGCGATKSKVATEQLLMSDAVDMAVAQIDFRLLAGHKVYLDPTYLQTIQGLGFVNAPYIISSIRQQITAAGCLLQDTRDDADVVIEARVGALGTNGHEITYGIPQTTALSSAAQAITSSPGIPVLPELALSKIDANSGIAKIYVFAYDKETRQPIWQSGVAKSESTSRNAWLFGAGPFQRGTIHDGFRFAGSKLEDVIDGDSGFEKKSAVPYFTQHEFDELAQAKEAEGETEQSANGAYVTEQVDEEQPDQ